MFHRQLESVGSSRFCRCDWQVELASGSVLPASNHYGSVERDRAEGRELLASDYFVALVVWVGRSANSKSGAVCQRYEEAVRIAYEAKRLRAVPVSWGGGSGGEDTGPASAVPGSIWPRVEAGEGSVSLSGGYRRSGFVRHSCFEGRVWREQQ